MECPKNGGENKNIYASHPRRYHCPYQERNSKEDRKVSSLQGDFGVGQSRTNANAEPILRADPSGAISGNRIGDSHHNRSHYLRHHSSSYFPPAYTCNSNSPMPTSVDSNCDAMLNCNKESQSQCQNLRYSTSSHTSNRKIGGNQQQQQQQQQQGAAQNGENAFFASPAIYPSQSLRHKNHPHAPSTCLSNSSNLGIPSPSKMLPCQVESSSSSTTTPTITSKSSRPNYRNRPPMQPQGDSNVPLVYPPDIHRISSNVAPAYGLATSPSSPNHHSPTKANSSSSTIYPILPTSSISSDVCISPVFCLSTRDDNNGGHNSNYAKNNLALDGSAEASSAMCSPVTQLLLKVNDSIQADLVTSSSSCSQPVAAASCSSSLQTGNPPPAIVSVDANNKKRGEFSSSLSMQGNSHGAFPWGIMDGKDDELDSKCCNLFAEEINAAGSAVSTFTNDEKAGQKSKKGHMKNAPSISSAAVTATATAATRTRTHTTTAKNNRPTKKSKLKANSTPQLQQPRRNSIASSPSIVSPPNTATGGTTRRPYARATGSRRYRRKCEVEGCPNRVVQGGVCISHGAKRKVCGHPGCTKHVKKAGMCSKHGPPRKRCGYEGCAKVAVQAGRCIAHGARKRICYVEGCAKQAVVGGICKKHYDMGLDEHGESYGHHVSGENGSHSECGGYVDQGDGKKQRRNSNADEP